MQVRSDHGRRYRWHLQRGRLGGGGAWPRVVAGGLCGGRRLLELRLREGHRPLLVAMRWSQGTQERCVIGQRGGGGGGQGGWTQQQRAMTSAGSGGGEGGKDWRGRGWEVGGVQDTDMQSALQG